MRQVWLLLLACFLGLTATGAEKEKAETTQWFSAKLDDLELKVRLVRDAAEITALLGSDLDKEYVLAEVELVPLYNTKVTVTRDDFLLRYYDNNERTLAESPDRVAGSAVLVLGKGGAKAGSSNVFTQSQEPVVIGGAPGTGTRPRRIDTPGGGIGGGTGGTTSAGTTEVKQDHISATATTLLERLEKLELPMGDTTSTIRGYLYFQMNPKYAPKKLSLNYDGTAGKSKVEFK